MDNINSVVIKNNQNLFDESSDIIVNSKRKYLLATRANACIGAEFLLLLKHMLPNVYHTYGEGINIIDGLIDIDENDCLIVVSFPRYSTLDLLAVQMAYESKAKIILITDKVTAPLSKYATKVFTVNVDTNTFFNSYVSVLFLAETLCSSISKKTNFSNEDKLKKVDRYIEQIGLF